MCRLREINSLILFWALSHLCFAQGANFKFEHVNEKQNLSHNSIIDISQDREGFLWFGTIDGLNRFDGYSCKIFKHNENDPASLSSNFVHQIYEDSKGWLWITTRDGGLNKFNKKTETFTHYRHNPADANSLSNDKVSAIVEDSSGKFWITTDDGLDLLDPRTGKFEHFTYDQNNSNSPSNKALSGLFKDKDGVIWITSVNGMTRFDPVKKIFKRFYHDKKNPNSLNDNFVQYIYKDEDDMLWITTRGGGLTRYDEKNNKFHLYFPKEHKKGDTKIPFFGTIIPYDKKSLLIGSDGQGLFLFDKEKKSFSSFENDPDNTSSVSSNKISDIFRDDQNNFWVGTWGGGVNKIIRQANKFIRYSNNPFDNNSLAGNFVFAILKDRSGNVWVGTSSGGLNKLGKDQKKFIHYLKKTGDKNSLSGNTVGAIFEDRHGYLWIASDGLNRFDVKNNKFKIFRYDPGNKNSISSNDIKCITEDSKGNVWIGVEGGAGGVCKYDINSGIWTRYFSDQENPILVRFIYEDKNYNLWFGTYRDGLIKFDPESGKTTRYKNNPHDPFSISYNDIRQITETKNGEMWIATYGGGINKFERQTGKFYSLKEKDGLSNNFTYAILEDDEENLWISTNYGITKYNRKNNSFKIYTVEDGLQNNEFNTGAFYKAQDGEMFFGGVNGFNRFYPGNMENNNHIPPVYFTSFKILDKEINTDSSILFKKNIELSYFDKFFSVEFAALDYSLPSNNNYEYKLEGFDDAWIKAGHRRFASYTNLDPGKYTLRVKASNNDDAWNNDGASLNIIVTPPFWRTWWFITLCGFAALSTLVGTVRYYSTKKLKERIYDLEKEKAVQKERERISRDLHDSVGSQLTNIITGIGLAEIYNRTEKPKADNLLASLKDELRETMTQLRETIWALKSNEMNFDSFISELKKIIEKYSKYFAGKIELTTDNNTNPPLMLKPLQVLYLIRIIQEAVTNSTKHSGGDKINIEISATGEFLKVIIRDNGIGIKEKDFDLVNGNGIENMKRRANEIGAELNLSSGKNAGVSVSVVLRLKDK